MSASAWPELLLNVAAPKLPKAGRLKNTETLSDNTRCSSVLLQTPVLPLHIISVLPNVSRKNLDDTLMITLACAHQGPEIAIVETTGEPRG